MKGLAIAERPRPQFDYNRRVHALLNTALEANLVLDRLEGHCLSAR